LGPTRCVSARLLKLAVAQSDIGGADLMVFNAHQYLIKIGTTQPTQICSHAAAVAAGATWLNHTDMSRTSPFLKYCCRLVYF
jgi:hypothetical protein